MKEERRTVILRKKEGERGAKKEKWRRIVIQRKKEGERRADRQRKRKEKGLS